MGNHHGEENNAVPYRTNATDMLAAGAALGEVRQAQPADCTPFVTLPPGYTAHDLESTLMYPLRERGTTHLDTLDSFVAFVNRHKDETASAIYASVREDALVAVLNDHSSGDAQWRDWRADYSCPLSDEWVTWILNSGKAMPQAAFAQFIEDNLPDIVTPDKGNKKPTAADMLIVSRTLEAKSSVAFAQGTRLQTGDVELSFSERTAATAGNGKFSVPESFEIGIPVYRSGALYRVTARLRYRISGGLLTMWYDLLRHKQVHDHAFAEVVTQAQKKTELPAFYGTP